MKLASKIKRRALDAGFDLAGIAPLAAFEDLAFAESWVAKGYGGKMRYLRNPKRADPRLILPSVKSVVCVGLVYNAPLPYSTDVAVARRLKLEDRNSKTGNGASAAGTCQIQASSSGQVSRSQGLDSRVSNFDFRTSASSGPRAWISRYAWGRDYHELVRTRLERLRISIEELAPGAETRAYVDTGPIVERAFARLSGIGWVGKNTCLINQQKGSWFFLGVVLTSLELEPDRPAFDRCGSCTRCLEACPTGALVEPYVMDASRCIAYFNIELKGPIPAEFRPAIGANVFGCDICQDVCPWSGNSELLSAPLKAGGTRSPEELETQNSKIETRKSKVETRGPRCVATTTIAKFHPLTIERATELLSNGEKQRAANHGQPPRERVSSFEPRFSLFNPRLEDLASLSEEDFRRAFSHSPIKRVKYRGWLRNLCVVIGNSGDVRFAGWLEKLRLQADDVVREHAEWALARLRSEASAGKP